MTDNPCKSCNGQGQIRTETAPGEWRWIGCGACRGEGTAWSAQLHAEFKRGWNAALDAVVSGVQDTRR